ncbi:hypothetical protein pdam_00003149 [Pocillopora damicornis]|uniref:Uncharacterized protein n=1 Tax=Pocillopora damicornis TaxID=46731 RepID=A0A3M6UAU7_POCDA|nr:hypothetical protein pdam_00003149 [Pocillopora damicornis]
MQSIEQHYYRETAEENFNGCKLLVKKDTMLDSLHARELLYAIVLSQAAQAHVSRKSQRLIHERVTRCVTRCSVTRGTVEYLNTL